METPRQKQELTLSTNEHNNQAPIIIKKNQIKVSKSHARKLSSDDENDNKPTTPTTKPKTQPQTQPTENQKPADPNPTKQPNAELKTQVAGPAKEKTNVQTQPTENQKTVDPNPINQSNTQPKAQVAGPAKEKISAIPVEPKDQYRVGQVLDENNKTPAKPQTKAPVSDIEPAKISGLNKVSQLDNLQFKDKVKHEESGMNSARSDRDLRVNFASVSVKNKKDNTQWPLDSGSRGTFEAYEKLMEAKGVPKNAKEIEEENKQLRQFLKDLNEQLQHHLEKVKVTDFENKKVEFKNKSPETQLRTIIRELANNEKILAYNKEEHRKTETRLNAIKDPKHVMKIQQEITKTQIQIDDIRRENKRMELKNGTLGKDLDVIENVKGIPASLEEIHLREKESAKFEHKLQILKQKNSELDAERKQKLDKQQAVSEQIRKLERLHFGDSYVSEQDMQKYNKLHKGLEAAEEDLKMTKNRCKFKAAQIARDMEELFMQSHKEREHVERLEEVVEEQGKALKELLSTSGARMSKGGQEVLDQIRNALENEEKRRMASPTNEEETRARNKERSATLLKNKSIGGIKQLDSLHYDLGSPTPGSSKHKNTIKRELAEKKPTYKETGPVGRPKLEELGNVKSKARGSEEYEGDMLGRKQSVPQKSAKKDKRVKEEEDEEEFEEEEVKGEKSPNKKEMVNESPREVKIKNKEDSVKEVKKQEEHRENENELKKEKEREQERQREKEKEMEKQKEKERELEKQKEKEKEKERQREKEKELEKEKEKKQKEKVDGEENADQLKQDIKKISNEIESEVTNANKNTVKKSQLKITNLHAKKLLDDADDETEIKTPKKKEEGLGNEHNNTMTPRQIPKNDTPKKKQEEFNDVDMSDLVDDNVGGKANVKKENPGMQIDLNKSKPVENSPAKSKPEGESKRKEVKETDSKRLQQQESPQKSQRATHKEDAEVREWDESNDFGQNHRKQLNKPKETKQEPKKAAEAEFEEIEFDA